MKLTDFEKSFNETIAPTSASEFILYVPPSGAAVECPSLDAAANAASRFAARNPGKVVAVYQRVGQAFSPLREPEFVQGTPVRLDAPKNPGEADPPCHTLSS